MEYSSFFNSKNGDRKYKAEEWDRHLKDLIGNGIFKGGTNLQVTADGSGMSVVLQPGPAWINGKHYLNDQALTFVVSAADGSLNRVDRLVLCLDYDNRIITAQMKKGTFASAAVAPELQRDADKYELCLADISVPAGTTAITQSLITDTRLDNSVCGIVHAVVDHLDTSTFYNQIQNDLAGFKSTNEADFTSWRTAQQSDYSTWSTEQKTAFDAWLQSIKDVLDADTAGHLLNLVNQKPDKVTPTTAGNLAALDSNGNLTDTGKQTSDFAAASHASTHATGGSDPVKPEDIGAASNPITGTSSPTTSTVGVVGQFYIDTSSKQLYICTAIDNGVYTWDTTTSKQWKLLASYTTAGSYTFTVPGGITKLRAFIIGGGGSGGAFNYNSSTGDACGGSSGHSLLYFNDIVLNGQQFNVVVGSGGSPVQASYPSTYDVPGENGSSSSFDGHYAGGGSGGGGNDTLKIGGGQGRSSGHTRGTVCPAFGEIRYTESYSQASTTPSECFNPFDSHRVLIAGGFASDVSVELYKIDDYGNHGSSGVYSSSPDAHAIKGTSYGCGGGGCVQTNGDYTATSAAGCDGAVLVYGM